MNSEKMSRIGNKALAVLLVVGICLFTLNLGINLYKATASTGTVESFEVARGDKSLTCVTSWAGTQATMSCLPTQWMEAEVSYSEVDPEPELIPEHEYDYPDCSDDLAPENACVTPSGAIWPGHIKV